jgi:plasmid maintenance system antidote protein VapI
VGRAKLRFSPVRSRKDRSLASYVMDEMRARDWSPRRTALAADLPVAVVTSILSGGLLTRAAAAGLARAFGTSPAIWLELEYEFRDRAVHLPC